MYLLVGLNLPTENTIICRLTISSDKVDAFLNCSQLEPASSDHQWHCTLKAMVVSAWNQSLQVTKYKNNHIKGIIVCTRAMQIVFIYEKLYIMIHFVNIHHVFLCSNLEFGNGNNSFLTSQYLNLK